MQNEQIKNYEISGDLLRELEESYPDKLPQYEPTAFELGKMSGAREVIEKIKIFTNPKEYEEITDV